MSEIKLGPRAILACCLRSGEVGGEDDGQHRCALEAYREAQ